MKTRCVTIQMNASARSRPSISKTNVLYILAVNVNIAFAVRLPVVLNHYFFPSQV